MPLQVRALTPADQDAAWVLGAVAFGYRDRTMPADWSTDTPGRHTWGVFDADRLVARATDREQGHWFGGRLVPASGVAGVSVAPELRGQGVGRTVLTRLLEGARERGAHLSTLFPTTPFPYRSAGWEQCGVLTRAAVVTANLATIRIPPGIRMRPAVVADVPRLRELYRAMAREGAGIMDRSGPALQRTDDAGYLAGYDGVSVTEDGAGTVTGYASWDRGPGYDATGRVVVDDLVAADAAATAALLSMLGGWASVAPTMSMKVPALDPVQLTTAVGHAPIHDVHPWMLRVVDAGGAIAARGWPAHLDGAVDLELVDPVCRWNAGAYRLVLGDGAARLEPGGTGEIRLTPRGLAAWYAGAATPALLRRADLLAGGHRGEALLQAATAGPAPVLLDYF